MAPTSHLPKLSGATLDDADLSFNPAIYTSKDTRRIQKLAPLVTVDDLRKTGVLAVHHNTTSSLAYPGLTAKSLQEPQDGITGSGGDVDDGASDAPSGASGGGARGNAATAKLPVRIASPDQYDATAAARSTLLHERPNVVERMEKGVAVCGVLRDNRHYRLNSLGVFHQGVNDVRTRSMHRVELHKHLSSTNLRAPQGDKEVRSAVQQDNVGTRLEKMYNRVLKSQYLTDEPGSVTWGTQGGYGGGGGGGGGRGGAAGGGGGGLSQVASGMAGAGTASGPLGNGAGGGGPPGSLRKGPAGAVGAGGGGGPLGAGNSQRRLGVPGGMSTSTHEDTRAGPGPGPDSLRNKAQGSFLAPSHGTARSGGGATNSPTHTARAGMASAPSMLLRHGSPGPGGASSPGMGLSNSQQLPNPFAGAAGAGGAPLPNAQQQRELGSMGKSTARSADYWVKVTLPPEVIEAQLRHLAATTEANLRAYHARVAAVQDELLYGSGLGPEALGLNPDQVEQSLKIKLGQIQEVTTANDFNYSSLSRESVLASRLGTASKQLLTATSLPQFIRAALEHVTQHSTEMQQLVEPYKAKAEHEKTHQRRRLGKAAPVGLGFCAGEGSTPGAAGGAAAASASGGDGEGDGDTTRRSSSSEVWPEDGWSAPGHHASLHTGSDSPLRASEAGAGGTEGGEGSGAGTGAGERWRPPPPAKVGGSGSSVPTQSGTTAGGERKVGRSITTMRRPDAMITEEWMEEFQDQLLEIEDSPVAPHSPPDGIQPLPPLAAGDMDAGAYVRARLERLWGVLGMPPHTRLDMVLFFTSRDRALTFAGSLELWEAAAAAVLSREAQVEALVSVQHEIEANNADRLSLGALSALCVRVLQQTRWVAALSERLRQDCGWELTFKGQPYPGPDAISSTHLVAFMEMLRQATEVAGLRP
ncbi:hypothetical protein HYH02_000239 [Chlamydomonas schloesseri]|uniref:Uncharacterized protein n=1 Tax=Chlamydomonas schloesseri TaxID=2026947 RepID=A0A835WNG2_9CHLO|nr:hypothetical protein HYH02_000239 [Chlamydomonas schloesseri]|eukprot:KAG2450136.1 hypothetical protein HYH02_000239 [Chlamydomonas schloesseri]